jgi:hypothetical protein
MPGIGIGNAIGFNRGGGTDWAAYYQQAELFIELQPDATAGKDNSINAASANNNRGRTIVLTVGEFNNSATLHRGLIQFDLSTLPADAIILSTKLNFIVNSNYSDNARTFKLYRMKRAWTEGTGDNAATGDGATWNKYDGVNNWTSAGGFNSADCEQDNIGIAYIPAVPAINSSVEFTITGSTKASLDLGYGWLIKNDTENADLHAFYSSDYTTATKRASLLITYLVPNTGNSFLFAKSAYNPIMKSYYGSVWCNGANDYYFYYSDGTNVLRATSTNGLTWTPDTVNNPMLTPAAGTIDLAQIWVESGTWYMLYRSNEWGGTPKSIGLATSANGIAWSKSASNPVITAAGLSAWANTGSLQIDPWGIMKIGATYYLWINDVNQTPRQTGLVTSTDLITWTENANNPIFTNDRYCVTPIKYDGKYYLFVPHVVSAVSTPSPTRNTIEIYRDVNPTFLSGEREYLGNVMYGGGFAAFDNTYLDTPTIMTDNISRASFPFGDALYMYYCAKNNGDLWAHGLAIGDLSILKNLPARTEV